MVGFFSTAVIDDYERAARQGERDRSTFDFVLTVATDDLEKMLDDSDHPATLFGTVRAPELSPQPLTVRDGRFNLFVEDEQDDSHAPHAIPHATARNRRSDVLLRRL